MSRAHGAASSLVVGREQPQAELLEAWESARVGRGVLAIVSGAAGIGKTWLLEHVAGRIGGQATMAWGGCTPDAPAFWPWRAVLERMGQARFDFDAPGEEPKDVTDPVAARTRRHVSIVTRAREAAGSGPALIVLDDLHWADLDSLAVIRLLATEIRRLPMLCVLSLRPDEPTAASSEIKRMMVDLASSTLRIDLEGLPPAAVAELAEHVVGRPVDPTVVREITSRTHGNPLFVRELVRLMAAHPDEHGQLRLDQPLPPLVRDILIARTERLSPAAQGLLTVAAVAGRAISFGALADAADVEEEKLAASLAPAEDDQLVRLVDGVVRFEHDLVREAIIGSLDGHDRCRLEAAVAEALQCRGGPGSQPSELAAHLVAAVPLVQPSVAASATLTAGRASLTGRAPADAAEQLRRGIAVLDGTPSRLALELQLALGDAATAVGDREGSATAYEAAVALARAVDDPEGFAQAALGLGGMMARPRVDPKLVVLLEEALERLGARADALTARVTARLAHALLFSSERERRERLADDAVELARRSGRLDALAAALYVWILVHVTSSNFDARLARADELVAVGRASGSDEIEAFALHLHAHHMAEAGDFTSFDADVATYGALAERAATASWQWTAMLHRTMRVTMRGDLEVGDRMGHEAFRLGVASQHDVAAATYGGHLMALRTWQGRLGEHLDAVLRWSGEYRDLPVSWASVPYIRAEIGELDAARVDLGRILADGRLADVGGAHSWTVAVAMLARVAHLTGDASAASELRPLLLRLGDRHVVGPFAESYHGPAQLYAALCAVTGGDLLTAESELAAASETVRAIEAGPVAAWITAELADVADRGGERERAAHLANEARDAFRTLGMARHLERLERSWPAQASIMLRPASAPPANRFVRGERGWEVSFDGVSARLGDTKGLRDLHRLVAAPNERLHVTELAADGGPSLAGGSMQPVLDDRAKQHYRAHIAELRADLDEAEAFGDLARAEHLRVELDALLDELDAAVGIGGRDRRLPDHVERARQAVRARIRYALDQVAAAHPALHRHLQRSVTTGVWCTYEPEQPIRWET